MDKQNNGAVEKKSDTDKKSDADKKTGSEKKQIEVKGIIARLKKVKHIEIIVAGVAVIIMIAIYFSQLSTGSNNKKSSTTSDFVQSNYCTRLQSDLESLVSKLNGAGKAKVLISWESSIELILAESSQNGSSSTNTSPIIIQSNGSSAPVVLKEIYPKAVGVLIICQGGNDPKIKVNLILAVSTLLDISQDKVIVYAMEK